MLESQLRVWWIPQIGMSKVFYIDVKTLVEAKLLLNTLASYDLFQYKNNVKGDYANAGGLEMFIEEENEWCDWYDEKTDMDIRNFSLEELRTMETKAKLSVTP